MVVISLYIPGGFPGVAWTDHEGGSGTWLDSDGGEGTGTAAGEGGGELRSPPKSDGPPPRELVRVRLRSFPSPRVDVSCAMSPPDVAEGSPSRVSMLPAAGFQPASPTSSGATCRRTQNRSTLKGQPWNFAARSVSLVSRIASGPRRCGAHLRLAVLEKGAGSPT